MALESSGGRAARIATFALMGVAYLTCEIASTQTGKPTAFGIVSGILLFAVALLLNLFGPRPTSGRRLPFKVTLILGISLVVPFASEPLIRRWSSDGFPLELQMVHGLRSLGVLLAGLSIWPQYRRLAGVVALFLALFASAMGDQPAVPYLLAAFAVTGGIWLICDHRARTAETAVGVRGDELERVRLRLPYREAAVFGALALAAAGVALAGPKRVMFTLGELMPTSGGTGDTDPFARNGIGDGPEETAGENAQAAGMVETDKTIEDNKNALIDAVNDMYGPPHKPPKDQQRMVAAGLAQVIEKHGRLPDNRRPSRDFDTARQGTKRDGWLDSQGARGIFEVEGRTPLHVRLVAYDRYDAVEKRWEEGRKPGSLLLDAEGDDWMKLAKFQQGIGAYANDDRHRLKVADLKTNLVPTPTLLTRFRIKKVDKPDYYEWDYDGVATIASRKSTPPGVVVTTDCRTVDPSALPEIAFAGIGSVSAAPSVYGEVPDELRVIVDRLAKDWAGDAERGWPQIAAVLDRLRSDYTLDPQVVAPKDHPSPLLEFLTVTKRGPDYLFATAAALCLRSLGYPTRVCLGYYVSPDAYDAETDHTPVRKTDLHVWPEVLLRDGHWLVVEPTPGYGVLPPLKPWHERLAERALSALRWGWRNSLVLAAIGLSVAILVWRRKRILDAIFTTAWRVAPGRTWHDIALRALRVLERRSRFAGRPRPVDQTLAAWANELPAQSELREFLRLAEWAAYGPANTAPAPDSEVLIACRRAVEALPLHAFATPTGVTAR